MVLDSKEKIVGILFSFTLKRDEFKAKSSFYEYRKSFPHAQAVIRAMYDELLYPGDVFEKYPDVTKICNMFALATLPNYRGKYVRADFCILNLDMCVCSHNVPHHLFGFENRMSESPFYCR